MLNFQQMFSRVRFVSKHYNQTCREDVSWDTIWDSQAVFACKTSKMLDWFYPKKII